MKTASRQSLKQKLYDIIFKSDTPAGKLFDVVLLVLILLSVLTVMLESIVSLQQKYETVFRAAEWGYTVLFTLELLLRIWVYPQRLRYIFSFFGMVDLLAILPTYISLIVPGTQYFMVIRVLRLLRIGRIFKLTHFLKEASMLSGALRASLPKILVFIGTVFTLVIIIGSVMYVIEGGRNGFTSIPKSI
ncbi:MAG: ion transporter, partial [Cytophagales bacterium CG18_big_fil_WC_8_21_14_2_50_42_9]